MMFTFAVGGICKNLLNEIWKAPRQYTFDVVVDVLICKIIFVLGNEGNLDLY